MTWKTTPTLTSRPSGEDFPDVLSPDAVEGDDARAAADRLVDAGVQFDARSGAGHGCALEPEWFSGRRIPGRHACAFVVGHIVSAACGMLTTGGALFAGEMYLSQEKYFTDVGTYQRAIADHIIENDTAFAGFGVVIHGGMEIVGVFVGLVLVVLAIVAFSGRGWARAVSWLFGLPILLWYGLQASLGALSLVFAGDLPSDTDSPELTRRFDEAWPPWLNTLDTVLMVAVAVLLMAALVCQTLPVADRYFRGSAPR